ncbi:MAG TPA: DinB family protein [Candidatus Dormibacteraeota bacterium]
MPEASVDPALNADERTTLAEFLEDQRRVLAWKCQGLSPAQLKEAAVPPSKLTLLGLLRHMAEVERSWFRRRLMGEEIERIWDTGADFEVGPADVAESFSRWEDEIERSRAILRQLESLDVTFSTPDYPVISARSMVNHMIEEYSRHNGHADLIRERIDGATGDFPPEPTAPSPAPA